MDSSADMLPSASASIRRRGPSLSPGIMIRAPKRAETWGYLTHHEIIESVVEASVHSIDQLSYISMIQDIFEFGSSYIRFKVDLNGELEKTSHYRNKLSLLGALNLA